MKQFRKKKQMLIYIVICIRLILQITLKNSFGDIYERLQNLNSRKNRTAYGKSASFALCKFATLAVNSLYTTLLTLR